jgi:alkylation response protein AidB-like acyl-CoA dehydrogenase
VTAMLDEDLRSFRETARALLRARSTSERVRATFESPTGVDDATWSQAARQLGVQSLLVPEELGGADAGIGAVTTALEELSGSLTAGPYLTTAWAAFALSRYGCGAFDAQLAAIADGTIKVAAALPQVGLDGRMSPASVRAIRYGADSVRVDGTIPAVGHVAASDGLVLLAEDAGCRRLVFVDLSGAPVAVDPLEALDLTSPTSRVRLSKASATAVTIEEEEITRLLDLASILVAADQLGLLREVLERDVAYTCERTAFGRQIGSFQAVKHQLAEFACLFEQGQAMLDDAVLAFDAAPAQRSLSAAACAVFLAGASVQVATEGLRLLGGIGFTWEHDAHLFYRRARGAEALLGNPYGLRRRLALLLGLTD